MAVDTAARRFSMMSLGMPGRILPIPDGAIGTSDRAHFEGLYSGIALDPPTVVTARNFRRSGKKPRLWREP